MNTIVQVGDVQMTADDIVNYLKFNNEFEEIAERIIKDKIAVAIARQRGVTLSADALQKATDDFRRYAGLHRAKETQEWLEGLGVTVDDFEAFITDLMLKNTMIREITTEKAVEEYFALHSPKFESVDFKQLILDDKNKAEEIAALLADDPDLFDELVLEHSVDEDTRFTKGLMMRVRRGSMAPDLEAKVFNAQSGDIVGPVQFGDEDFYAIVAVLQFHPAELTEEIQDEVAQTLYDEWLAERAKELTISIK